MAIFQPGPFENCQKFGICSKNYDNICHKIENYYRFFGTCCKQVCKHSQISGKVANLMAKNCRAIQLTNSKLACFANFLYFFAKYFADFAKLFVKISNNLCLLWVNFPTKKLAIIAKNFAKGKNVTQLFGNYLGCLIL